MPGLHVKAPSLGFILPLVVNVIDERAGPGLALCLSHPLLKGLKDRGQAESPISCLHLPYNNSPEQLFVFYLSLHFCDIW